MINIEKQIASESVDDDLLNISTLIDSDHEMEDEDEAEINRKQQAKKIVEVDNVIVEKEEILKKLLDTVRGYSAMKVRTVCTVGVYALFVICVCVYSYVNSFFRSYLFPLKKKLFAPRFSKHYYHFYFNFQLLGLNFFLIFSQFYSYFFAYISVSFKIHCLLLLYPNCTLIYSYSTITAQSDFERLLEAIGTLESERQSLETELERTKRNAENLTLSASQSPPPSNSSIERIKERYVRS